jgi:23S rRNA (cytosine1962-C5)-methyltransferase
MAALFPVCPLRLKKGCDEAVRGGMPWVYAGDIIESSELVSVPAGSLVSIENAKGQFVGTGYYNAASQIACRVLTLSKEGIDAAWFVKRFERALGLREKAVGVPYYRLAHSEGDFLPGLLVDRFGEVLAVQSGTAGMDGLQAQWLEALVQLLSPKAVVLRNDTGARLREGLAQEVRVALGDVAELVEIQENGCYYFADVLKGQKTGWFFDQRDNRKLMAGLSAGKRVIDIYSHSGGFGVLAAKAGAAAVTLVDSSKLALSLAEKTAARNAVSVACVQGDAFEVMAKLAAAGERYDVVLADPPAFVKSKKDIAAGMKGYEKVVRLAAGLCAPGGVLFTASCSHYASRGAFNNAVMLGAKKAGFTPHILKQTGTGADHPAHPKLPQGEYLKGILLQL